MGTGHLIYHGAEHSRFGHSLGVMEVATRMLQAVRSSRPDLLGEPDKWERYEQLLRLSALLHDVGHAPFSHASDEIFPDDGDGKLLKHEDYTAVLILKSDLRDIIDRNFNEIGITADDVVNVFADPARFDRVGVLLQDIVAGELDADRMDYLARDSLYAGVTYGRYDLDRLLDTITAIENDKGEIHLAVQNDGRHALEAFLLARYYMFLQVYLHRYRRFYDIALTRVIQAALKSQGGRYPGPSEWQAFLSLDDVWLQAQLPERAAGGDIWAVCLHGRRHWKVVAEHVRGTMDRPEPSIDAADWMAVIGQVRVQFGDEVVAFDDARAKNFQRTDPAPYISGKAEEVERPKILLENRSGAYDLVENQSGIVEALSRDRIRIRRLYARPDKRDEVRSAWEEALSKRG